MTLSQRNYSANDVAEELSIHHTTVKKWAQQFEVPSRRKGHKWVFNDDSIAVLKTIQRLKDEDCGQDTIRATIAPQMSLEENVSQKTETQVRPDYDAPEITQLIDQSVSNAIEKYDSIAEKFARATHEIGRLEAQLESAQEKLKVLPDPVDHSQVKAENERLKAELEVLKGKQEKAKQHWLIRLMFKELF